MARSTNSTKTNLCGFLNVAKPAGMTAHDVVASLRKIMRTTQVGHGGTLDPMATGVLPVAIGKATRLLRFLPGDKTYLAEIMLGRQTTTDDITGDTITETESSSYPDESSLNEALSSFRGQIQQLPPMYSAVHVGGRRLYELARRGETPDSMPVPIPVRNVVVHSLQLISYKPPIVTARLTCAAGTYIRSIARDLGANLGCGGCLNALSREQAGPFHLADAITLDELRESQERLVWENVLVKPEQILPLSIYRIDELQAQRLMMGQALYLQPGEPAFQLDFVMALYGERLIAICRCSDAETDQNGQSGQFVKIQPEVVIANGIIADI
jgi:tRNA pseudouridine55 synthase